MDALLKIVATINDYLSDYVLTFLLVGCGIYFSWRTRFVQIRCFREGWRNAFGSFSLHGKKHSEKGASAFQALSAAVAAQVGTGNIVGASGAILVGGPGSIFWMWLIAFLGMATSYAEAVLAQETRVLGADQTYCGGPVYYINKAFHNGFGRFFGVFFAGASILALGCVGGMVQANSIGETCANAFHIPSWVTGIVIAVCAASIFAGGANKLIVVTEKLVPLMAMLYLLGGTVIVLWRIEYLPAVFHCIFYYAFSPEALLGGGWGYALKTAVSQGVKRGLFSNEAGMGTAPHAHALAAVKDPHVQGTVAMIGVFIDTMIVLTMTALVVISTLYVGDGPLASANGETYQALLAANGLTQTNLVQVAVASVSTAAVGNSFVAICLLFFAFSTILGWNYFARINFQYLFGNRFLWLYFTVTTLFVFTGTMLKSDLIWALQDMFNQLMVLPNVLAIVTLGSIVKACALSRKE